MRNSLRIGGAFVLLALIGLVWVRADAPPKVDPFKLTSPAFVDGGSLPVEFTCDGAKASPPLEWSNVPEGTKSFAISMHHIPGPGDTHVYIVLYKIGADVRALARNAKDVGVFGINTVNGQQEYTPPCSKGPGPKKYTLTVYALSAEPKIDGPADAVTMDMLLNAIKDTTLAKAEMNVTYDRGGNAPEARGPGGPEGQALSGLKLTGDQQKKIEVILSDFRNKQDAAREELLKQMKDVLDPAQYEQFEKSFKRPPPPPPDADGGDAPPQ